MPPTHAVPAPPAPPPRRGRALHLLVRTLSPTYGSRRNAAEALQVLASTAPERRAAALRSGVDAEGGRQAVPASRVTAGQPW